MKRVARLGLLHAVEALALVLAAAVLLCAGAVFWLSRGPVSLEVVRADVEAALADAIGGDVVSVSSVDAVWSPEDRSVVIALADVAVAEAGGRVLAEAPRIEAGVSLRQLLRGRVSFSRLTAEGGRFSIVRRADGAIIAGVGGPEDTLARPAPIAAGPRSEATAATSGLRAALARLSGGDLVEFRMKDAVLYLRDEITGIDWRADNAVLDAAREGEGVAARVSGDVAGRGGAARINLVARASLDFERAFFEGFINAANPAELAPDRGPLAALSALDAPVSAAMSVAVTEDRGVLAADLRVDVAAGVLRLADREEEVRAVSARAAYDPGEDTLDIAEAMFDVGVSRGRAEGTISAAAALIAGVAPESAPFDLTFSDLVLDLRPIFEKPLAAKRIHAQGAYRSDARRLRFDALDADILDLKAALTGSLAFQEASDGRTLPAVRLVGPVEGEAGWRDVIDHWPVELADGAREWLIQAIKSGTVRDAYLDLDLPVEALVAQRLDDDKLTLSFAFDDASVAFVSTMTPVRDGAGTATLRGNSFSLQMQSGKLKGLTLTKGFVEIPVLNPKGAIARFGTTATGPARDVLQFIDEPPLRLATGYGIDPKAFEGTGSIAVEIRRPMLLNVPAEDIGFEVSGAFQHVTAQGPIPALEVADAKVDITADTKGLTAHGDGRLGPAPATVVWTETFDAPKGTPRTKFEVDARIDTKVLDRIGAPARAFLAGEVGLNVVAEGEGFDFAAAAVTADLLGAELMLPGAEWRKPQGAPGIARLTVRRGADNRYLIENVSVDAGELAVAGDAAFGPDGRMEEVSITRAVLPGVADVRAGVTRGDDGALVALVEGAELDVRGIASQLISSGSAGGFGAPVKLTARLDSALVTDAVSLTDLRLSLDHDGKRVKTLSFEAQGPRGPVSARIAPMGETGARRLTASAADAGVMLEALFGYGEIEGGQFDLEGELPALDAPDDAPTTAKVTVRRFRLVGAPAFAQVLSLGSLQGLADTLGGEGITFERLTAPAVLQDGVLTLKEARASGSALGVTVSGDVGLAERTLDLEGVLVPVYTFNSFLGGIPLVGDLFVSRQGEGVFALTYNIDGTFDETRVFVNPLSALTPGFLRRIFEGAPAQPPPEAALPAEKPDAADAPG